MLISEDKIKILASISPNNAYLITGGAGTGKTTLGSLIGEKLSQSLADNQKILYITYSKLAKKQISDKIDELVEKKVIEKQFKRKIVVHNYHSIWWELICRYKAFLKITQLPIICLDNELTEFAIHAMKSLQNIIPKSFLTQKGQVDKNKERALINALKGKAILYHEWDPNNFGEEGQLFLGERGFLAEASNLIIQRNLQGYFGHDETIYWIRQLVTKHPNFKDLFRLKYPVVIIDKFQDSDVAQWQLIKDVIPQTIIVMGDIAQTIHIWRGADAERFNQFEIFCKRSGIYKTYENHYLVQPHRSCKDMSKDKNIDWVEIKSDVNDIKSFNSAKIGTKIKVKNILLKKQEALKTIAVLCLDNKEANDIINFLRVQNVFSKGTLPAIYSHRVGSEYSPFETARLICSKLIKQINLDPKFISNELIQSVFYPAILLTCSKNSKKDILKTRWAQSEQIASIFKESFTRGLGLFIQFCEDEEKRSNVFCERLVLSCLRFILNSLIKKGNSFSDKASSEELRRFIDLVVVRYEKVFNKQFRISVMTIHQSKGREFDLVIIPWFSTVSWSNFHGGNSWNMKDDQHINLFHTARTRAKQKVVVIFPKGLKA